MSTKTIKQHIALVAVSSLTAGLLSIIATPSANAAVTIADKFSLAIGNSATGTTVVTAGGGDTTLDKSVGFVAVTSAASANQEAVAATAVTLKSSATGTASMLATGKVVLGVTGGAITDRVAISCLNGTLSSRSSATIASTIVQIASNVLTVTATGHGLLVGDRVTVDSATDGFDVATAATITGVTANTFTVARTGTNAGPTTEAGVVTLAESDPFNSSATAVYRSNGKNPSLAVVATPNAGATSMTCSAWKGTTVTAATPTVGTLIGQWVITIVSSSLSGAYSAADSSVYQQAAQPKGTACTGSTAYDVVASVGNGRVGCIWVNPKDAYGVAVSAGSLTASATNGAKVAIGASPTGAEGYTASVSFASATSAANTYVSVVQGTANTGGSTVVTIAWQGVVIGTKTITFQGDIAKLTFVAASSNTTYKNGAVATDAKNGIVWVATDALGQVVDLAAGNVSISDATGAMTPAVLDVSTANSFVTQTTTTGAGSGTMTIATNALVGAGTYRLKVTNAAGTDIKSDVINAVVSGGAATFTAAWNKASYSPGEIAELTITAKDSGGRGLAQGIAFGTGAAITVNTDGLTSLSTTCDTLSTATVVGADGSRVCKFAVKNTAGAYAYSVAVPTSTSQSAVTGSVKIAESAGTVSNAQVLQSIVALIASINKQIQALQKLILRR
jgi:hypothetical protein